MKHPQDSLQELRRLDWQALTPEQRREHAAEWAAAWRALLRDARRVFTGWPSTEVN